MNLTRRNKGNNNQYYQTINLGREVVISIIESKKSKKKTGQRESVKRVGMKNQILLGEIVKNANESQTIFLKVQRKWKRGVEVENL